MTGEPFEQIYASLRSMMLGALTGQQQVSQDDPGSLIVRTRRHDPKTGEPGWFGTVTIKKSYVAYHLMPLYEQPELAADISPELARRKQGKTCFNFKRADQTLYDELAALTAKAVAAG